MNLFFRNLLLCFLFVLLPFSGFAVTIYSLHTMECERELGLILDVRPFEVVLLTLEGQVKIVRNYEIIYMSSYSVNQIPLKSDVKVDGINGYEFYTRIGNTPVPLVKGFPVDFTKEKISIINYDGGETVIEKNKIWSINKFTQHDLNLNYSAPTGITFDMPQIFRDCQKTDTFPKNSGNSIALYPLQTLNDPLAIKRELDRLRIGYEEIEEMNQEQQFYAEPQYFKNISILGTWGNLQSRYGSSSYRTNQFLPTLINATSDGPFDFQQKTVTGVAPLSRGSHDEAQAQLSYELKSSYFHLSASFDPNLMLVGQNYNWTVADFKTPDIRVADKTLFEFGFDYSAFSLMLFLNHQVHTGFYDGTKFDSQDFALPRVGLMYRGLLYNIFITSGSNKLTERSTDFSIDLLRAHIEINAFRNLILRGGYITRTIEANKALNIQQASNSIYVEGSHIWNRRYFLGSLISNESLSNKTLQSNTQSTFVKTAVFIGFIF
ncbi:MAG: hypothetical protein JNL11_20540 [Bdellovibrionaceae bacterium]|nr:hypothetical protein [Pseudobdellovibrionaceae bacterium]